MKRSVLLFIVIASVTPVFSQPQRYGVANLHAHNDYDHNIPFTQAYGLQLGSIEADVHWIRDTLFVAHSAKELKRNVLFESSYLAPLDHGLKKHNGHSYEDTSKNLQLLIDIKTDSLTTLDAVINAIRKFPSLAGNPSVRFVITGRQPEPRWFDRYPEYIFFDGKVNDSEHLARLKRIALFSADFSKYSEWKGEGNIPETDLVRIKKDIGRAHALGRPFRFWGVPDNPHTWRVMMELGVDYINTDHIDEAARFIGAQIK